MFKQCEVQVLVDDLPEAALFRRSGDGGQRLFLLGFARRRSERPHEGAGHAAVQQQPPQDQEAASPSELVKEVLVERCQGAEEDGAACHR